MRLKTFISTLIFRPRDVFFASILLDNIRRFRRLPAFLQDFYIWLVKDNSKKAQARRRDIVMNFLLKNNIMDRLTFDKNKVFLLRIVSGDNNYGLMGVDYVPSKRDRGKDYLTFRDFQCDASVKYDSYGLGAFSRIDTDAVACVWVDIDDIEWANPEVNKVRCWRFRVCVPKGYWDFECGDTVLTPKGEGKIVSKSLRMSSPFLVEFKNGDSTWYDAKDLVRRPK